MLKLQKSRRVIKVFNESLMTNRRCPSVLGAMEEFGRAAYVPTSVQRRSHTSNVSG